MHIQIEFDDFKQTPLSLSEGIRYVAYGGQALIAEDRGTLVKFYYTPQDSSGLSAQTSAAREIQALDWFSRLDLQGIATPRPLELVHFETPVALEFSNDKHGAPWRSTCKVVSAVRMTRVEGVQLNPVAKMDVPYDELASHRNIGEVMAAFHQAAAGRTPPNRIYDPSRNVDCLEPTPSQHFNHISTAQQEWMLGIFQEVKARHPYDRVLHGDLHGGNLLADPKSGKIRGVVDFGATKMAAPEIDMLVYSHFLEEDGYQRRRDAVRQGYAETGLVVPDASVTAAYNLLNTAHGLRVTEQHGVPDPRYQVALYHNAVRHYHHMTGATPPDGVPNYQPAPQRNLSL